MLAICMPAVDQACSGKYRTICVKNKSKTVLFQFYGSPISLLYISAFERCFVQSILHSYISATWFNYKEVAILPLEAK